MGWWSCDVMGGDAPLDILGNLVKSAGGEFVYETKDPKSLDHLWDYSREQVTCALPRLATICEESKYDNEIYWQVLGHMALHTDAQLNETIKNSVIEAAQSDSWATENQERRDCMHEFIEKIKEGT